MNPLDELAEAMSGPLGEVVAGEEGDEGDGAAFDAEDDALCDAVGEGEGEAEPLATTDWEGTVDGVLAADDACAACAPHAVRVAPVSAIATVAAAFFALANATAGPSSGIPAGMPVQR
ncbi:hypothetical protein ACWEQ8_43095 [Streptomyces noursei]